jgi:uncharacterized membrane protein YfcA
MPIDRGNRPTLFELAIGFITNFLDTLGIGSFATTTAVFKAKGMVPDEKIPGTLNVGHMLPTITEAALFITSVAVSRVTLVSLIASAVIGAWIGAGIVAGLSRRNVQRGMAGALLLTGALIVLKQLNLFPQGGGGLELTGVLLVAGIVGNFIFGALMTLGIGLYAPCMGMVALLGMDPKAAFPIMMGSCAFLMPFSSARFIRARAYSTPAALGLAIGGIPGVFLAVKFVGKMSTYVLLWLVVVVVWYTAFSMWRSSLATDEVAAGVESATA